MADAEREGWIPDEYHVIDAANTRHFVLYDVRREVERWLKDGDAASPILDIVGVLGEDITLVRGAVGSIWSSNEETRRKERVFNKKLTDEVPVEERE